MSDNPTPRPSLWRNPDYMLLWSGQIVSTLGSAISGVAMPLLILALTNSPAAAGVAGALVTVPYVLFSLPAGAMIDRWDRKRVMMRCDAGRALAFASIPLALYLDVLTIWQVYLVAFIEGTLFVFFNIAEVAALPRVVARDQLGDATAQNFAAANAAGLVGPGLGGFLYQSIGRGVPFLLDAVSFTISVASLFLIKTRFQTTQEPVTRNLRAEIREGLAWMWNEPLVRFTSFLSGVTNLVFVGTFLIVIVLGKNLGASAGEIGTIFSIGAVGGVIGSAVGGRINRRFTVGQIVIASTWFNVLLFPLYAVAPNVLVLGLITAVFFTTAPIYSVAVLSYRLALIPDALQGRVNSAVRLLAFGFQPLGSLVAGVLLERIGAVPSVLVFAAILLAVGVLVLVNPALRQTGHQPEGPPVGDAA